MEQSDVYVLKEANERFYKARKNDMFIKLALLVGCIVFLIYFLFFHTSVLNLFFLIILYNLFIGYAEQEQELAKIKKNEQAIEAYYIKENVQKRLYPLIPKSQDERFILRCIRTYLQNLKNCFSSTKLIVEIDKLSKIYTSKELLAALIEAKENIHKMECMIGGIKYEKYELRPPNEFEKEDLLNAIDSFESILTKGFLEAGYNEFDNLPVNFSYLVQMLSKWVGKFIEPKIVINSRDFDIPCADLKDIIYKKVLIAISLLQCTADPAEVLSICEDLQFDIGEIIDDYERDVCLKTAV